MTRLLRQSGRGRAEGSLTVQDRSLNEKLEASDKPRRGKRLRAVSGPRIQYAALPFQRAEDGVQILLITSRETRRWVLPKGWPMPGRTPAGAAQREAFEEAGLRGEMAKSAFGAYAYYKRLKTGVFVPVRVEVFPMRVREERKTWPEKKQRERRWFAPDAAAAAVAEPELRALILAFAALERG